MVTTIQISKELHNELNKRKLFNKETYEEIIWDLIEDTMELSEETKRGIKQAEKEFKEGKFYTHKQVKKELGL
jgi:predicted transcriptional regulator|tara:strand:+ start:89 stop:307 length:219 start_codon:yes stop_codon:yes gene_type:complete